MSLSYAAHINGDKVYDIATGYYIEAVKEPAATVGRMQIAVYLYSPTGEVVDKFVGVSFPEADVDKYNFVGIEIVPYSATAVTYYLWTESISQYSRSISYAQQNSTTLKQYFSGEQGYAINADYAVIDVQPYSITENGTYTAPFSKAYSPVTVDVQEQPWQPLEDGYSNFWFELTNDTLSPWLNFSAKNNDAVIDWGDGSGEVALDTLTPTHTYSKAGKYVVKVKGVTGIAQQYTEPYTTDYIGTLQYVELSSDVTALMGYAFENCINLKKVDLSASTITIMPTYAFGMCGSLTDIKLPNTLTNIATGAFRFDVALKDINIQNTECDTISQYAFQYCRNLREMTFPATVTAFGASSVNSCSSLSVIHMLPTTPPTVQTNAFASLPAEYVIYVPVGTLAAYQTAWSTYADHILEEGQTPNRAMLSRLAKAVETDTDEDMR